MRESGQTTMFDLFGESVDTPLPTLEMEQAEVSRGERLAWEKEVLGVYVSEHPFSSAAAALSTHITAVCGEITAEMAGREVVLAGMVTTTRNLFTREGRTFCAAVVEDLSGNVEVTIWPEQYERTRDLWVEGNILIILARIRERGERLQVSVQQVALYQAGGPGTEPLLIPEWVRKGRGGTEAETRRAPSPRPAARQPSPPSEGSATVSPRLLISLRETEDEAADRERLADLMAALVNFPGEDELRLVVHTRVGERVELALPPARACEELRARAAEVLGDQGSAEFEERVGARAPSA
jgi:DNA polymerase-3 subunit alpha